MKKIFKLTLLTVLVMSLVACSSTKKEAENKEKDPITIVLDWVPNTNHTGLYVALEKGFFGDLNVEVVQPPEGSTTALIGSGGAPFGISFQDTIAPALAKDERLPITAVAALIQHNTSGIISLKETNINRPKDLTGKNYGTWDSPIELAMMKHVVNGDGGTFDEVELIPNNATDTISALKTEFDSVWIYYGWDGIGAKVHGLDTNFIAFRDYGEELDYYSPILIANNEYLEKNPEEAKAVLAGIKQGYEFAIDNPVEAGEILVKHAPESDKELVIESQKWLANEYKAEEKRWGYINPERWGGFYTWLNDNKLLEQEIDPAAGFSNDYLPE